MTKLPEIHPDAFIASNAIILGDVTVERDASIWYGCVVRGDLEPISIGEGSNIQDLTVIHTDENLPALIGARVGVGHRSLLHGCVIEDECLIGMGAILLSGSVIGSGSVVAAGTLVTEGTRVPEGSLVMGAPARIVRPVDDELRQRIRHTADEYIAFAKAHRSGGYPPAAPSWGV
ncbi:MAG TPA: gamma carbonic anhydrase family protein [Gemmatimonadota bacterium]|nr:gamma carbonic anhydrase family protein [Gemmatimonadota bacterium]